LVYKIYDLTEAEIKLIMKTIELQLQHKILEMFAEHFFKRNYIMNPDANRLINPMNTKYFEEITANSLLPTHTLDIKLRQPSIKLEYIVDFSKIDLQLAIKLMTNLVERELLWKQKGSVWEYNITEDGVTAALGHKLLYEKQNVSYTTFERRKNKWSFVLSILAIVISIIALLIKNIWE